MRVAVTGAAGFLGGAVCRAHLEAGDDVVALARRDPAIPRADYRNGDLHDASYLRRALGGVDVVQHIAARVRPVGSYADFRRDNIDLTQQVYTAAADAGARGFVYCSSPSVAFNGTPIRGADESIPRAPMKASPYSLTKAEAEEWLGESAPRIGLPVIIVRPHLIWGPGDRHLLPGLLRISRLGVLPRPSGRDAIVDPVHITDAARAHLLAARAVVNREAADVRTYVIGGRDRVSLWDAATGLIEAATGRRPRVLRLPAAALRTLGLGGEAASVLLRHRVEVPLSRFTVASLLEDQWYDTSAAAEDLGFTPAVGLEEGLAALRNAAD